MGCMLFVFCAAFSTFHHSPADDLPAPAELFSSVRNHWNSIAEAEAKAYRTDWKKDRWADYMPSVGVAYTPSGAPRPGVSFSLGSLIASRKKKRESERIEARIFEVYRLKAEDEIRIVKAQLNEIERLTAARSLAAELLEIERLVFAIAQDEFDTAALDPKSYLMAKRKWLIVQNTYAQEELKIEKLKSEVLLSAHFG